MINNEINWRIKHGWDKSKYDVEKDWLDRIPLGRYQMPNNIAKQLSPFAQISLVKPPERHQCHGGYVME